MFGVNFIDIFFIVMVFFDRSLCVFEKENFFIVDNCSYDFFSFCIDVYFFWSVWR